MSAVFDLLSRNDALGIATCAVACWQRVAKVEKVVVHKLNSQARKGIVHAALLVLVSF